MKRVLTVKNILYVFCAVLFLIAAAGCRRASESGTSEAGSYSSAGYESIAQDSAPESEASENDTPEAGMSKVQPDAASDRTSAIQDDTVQNITPEVTAAQTALNGMNITEKICQLFFVQPEALNLNPDTGTGGGAVTQMNGNIAAMLGKYPVGGIVFFKGNIVSPAQVAGLQDKITEQCVIPPVFSVDEEGGRVARIAECDAFGVPRFKSMLSIGDTGNPDNAYGAAMVIGTYLKQNGFGLDFAPVADIFTNPKNTVIGDRAFGRDAQTVSAMVTAAMDGFSDSGIISCVKHFPGHGDTAGDTHSGSVYVNKDWNALLECELIPFIRAIENNADMIMAAHITLPHVTSDGLPASLSYEMLTGRLRGELGFKGVISTDSLSMRAITAHYTPGQAAAAALSAGADIILMPASLPEAYNGILSAVNDGAISMQRLDESVLRILTLKEKYGML